MPAYNEEGCIEDVVVGWIAEFDRRFQNDFLVVVVNDGSKDKTGQILDSISKKNPRLVVHHKKNGGHGSALLTGYAKALEFSPDYIFQVDSDSQFIPESFEKLWDKIPSSSFILGYRKSRYDAFHRLVITRILRMLLWLAYGVWIIDSNVPYRLIKGDYLKKLLDVMPSNVFAPNIFLSVLAAKDGQQLFCVPVTHKNRETGEVSIVRWKLIKVCLRCARELLSFRLTLNDRISRLRAGTRALHPGSIRE
jgi:dolichol-phosphate mannosyltransferase